MGFDIGDFLSKAGDKLASSKGYTDLGDLLTGSVAKNVARLTDRTNETKQTPPTVPPSDYAAELLGEQKIMGLTPVQLAAIAALGLVGIYLVVRR